MNKTVKQYYRQRLHGGRGTAARTADTLALFALLITAGYLWFRYHTQSRLMGTLLSVLVALLMLSAWLLLRMRRFERFVKKEQQRLSDIVLRERVLLMPLAGFYELCDKAIAATPAAMRAQEEVAAQGRNCHIWRVQKSAPLTQDDIMFAYHAAQQANAALLVICSLAPIPEKTVSLLDRLPIETALVCHDALLEAAHATPGYAITQEDVEVYIHSEMGTRQKRRAYMQAQPFLEDRAKKYLFCAALLFAVSFFAGYSLYYRLLAGICLMLAGTTFFVHRPLTRPTGPSEETLSR